MTAHGILSMDIEIPLVSKAAVRYHLGTRIVFKGAG